MAEANDAHNVYLMLDVRSQLVVGYLHLAAGTNIRRLTPTGCVLQQAICCCNMGGERTRSPPRPLADSR